MASQSDSKSFFKLFGYLTNLRNFLHHFAKPVLALQAKKPCKARLGFARLISPKEKSWKQRLSLSALQLCYFNSYLNLNFDSYLNFKT